MKPVRDSIHDIGFSIREISEKAAQTDDVIRLDIGQPDFDTPQAVKEQVAERIQDQQVTYTSLWGIPELREQIAAAERHKLALDPEHTMVTTGGIGALYCILNGLLGHGDNVVANDPAWPPYELITAATPGQYRQAPYVQDGAVQEQQIEQALDDNTKALILNSPENPTGRVYTEEQVQHLGEIAEQHDLWIIADEVYDRLLYDTDHASPAAAFPDRTIVVNSLSKNYAMTGWRLGWAACTSADLIEELGKVNRATTACPNFAAQQAALIALQDCSGYADEMVDTYQERRDLVMNRINKLGWDCVEPQGAFYAFPDVGRDSWDFAYALLDEAGVSVVPGEACGTHSDTNVRICFGSVSREALDDAFDRIERFVS